MNPDVGSSPPSRTNTRAASRALAAAAAALLVIGAWDLVAEPSALAKGRGGPRGQFEYGCRVQAPQKFLERRSFVVHGMLDTRKQTEAVRYRSEHYGKPEDDGASPGATAFAQAKTVHFMGLPISIHAKIAPALACVEKRLLKTATGSSRYKPRAIGGFRTANTYRGVEVSNHLYGIAVDIDPDKNPCCGCVDPWPSNPICKNTGSVYDRTALPKAWIKAFERFGFDWLGHDTLEDTMHFEFLGDPDRIAR
jgi:D-alanyl-D-alanine carboxypeptidase